MNYYFYQSSLFSGDKVKASNSNNDEKLNFRLIWRYYCNFFDVALHSTL
jgi:hypothetical protein